MSDTKANGVAGAPMIMDAEQRGSLLDFEPIASFMSKQAADEAPATEEAEDAELPEGSGEEADSDEEEADSEADAEEEGEGEEEVEEEEEEEEAEPAKKPPTMPRTFKVKVGEESVTLTDEIELTHKVDGKPVKVTLAELLNTYSGEKSIERKYEEFRLKEKAFETEQKNVKSKLDEVEVERQAIQEFGVTALKFFETKNPGDLINAFTQLAGESIDQIDMEVALLEALTPAVKNWLAATPEQRAALVNSRKVEVYKDKARKTAERSNQEKAHQETVRHLESLCKEHNIPHEEFVERFNELREMAQEGHLKVDRIEPQHVVGYIDNLRAQKRVEAAVEKVNPALNKDSEAMAALFEVARSQKGLSEQDLIDIVREVYGASEAVDPIAERVNKKLARNANPGTPAKKKPAEKVTTSLSRSGDYNRSRNPVTLDDL